MVSADGGDVYPIVLVTEVHVTLVALHVPLEDMDIGACMLTLSWYNSNMNVGTSNHLNHISLKRCWPVGYTGSLTAQDTSWPLHWG